MKESKLN